MNDIMQKYYVFRYLSIYFFVGNPATRSIRNWQISRISSYMSFNSTTIGH